MEILMTMTRSSQNRWCFHFLRHMQAYIFLYSARSQNQIKTCRISFLLPVDEEYFPHGVNHSTDLSDSGSISHGTHRWMILLIWLSFFSPAACRWIFSFDWGKFPFEGTLPGHSNLPVLKICQFTSEINNNYKVLRSFCGATKHLTLKFARDSYFLPDWLPRWQVICLGRVQSS